MKQLLKTYCIVTLLAVLLFTNCVEDDDAYVSLLPETGEEFSGGDTTIFDISRNAFGFDAPNLSNELQIDFGVGNSLFNQNWVTAPASTTARDGLGPLFNARSCAGCHAKDGRGRPPEFIGEVNHGLLLRLAIGNEADGTIIPDPNYGNQLQDQAILGVDVEAAFEISYEQITGSYPDGATYALRKPTYTITNTTQGQLTAAAISPRVANHMSGLGLLEAISETTLQEFADENDADGDGISGKINYVLDIETNTLAPGRFGWKANEPNIRQQVAAAFAGDLGITSSLFPEENCPPSVNCADIPNGGSPEIEDANLEKTVLYSSSLAVPGRRDWQNQQVLEGKELFISANCTACHKPKIVTGVHPTLAIASNQTIRPYTDLLVHDMGAGLADGSQEFRANGNEWRTAPLWGIGLIETVNNHSFLLHDGRARDVEEAILWHGGEAEVAKNTFINFSSEEREKLIAFVNSL